MRLRKIPQYWPLAAALLIILLAGCEHTLRDPPLTGCRQDCRGRFPVVLDQVVGMTGDGTLYYSHRDALGTQVVDGECQVIVDSGSQAVWRCGPDGADPEQVWPGWGGMVMSPDGGRAVFGGYQPSLVEFSHGQPDSSTIRPLGIYGLHFRWRPDGKALGYQVRIGDYGTYVFDPDSSDPPEHVSQRLIFWDWSPDGRSVVGWVAHTDSMGIYNIDDGTLRVLPVTAARSARWSPRGDRIAYTYSNSLGPNFRVLYLESGATRDVATFHVEGMDWTPDGAALIVTRFERYSRITSTNGTLWRVDARNGNARPLTDAPCLRGLDP